MNPNTFSIKTEAFEGPLPLLIELVEKRKLLINDISLAEVTDEYMQTVSLMQELSLPNTAQFITLAATLLLIKSKSLLPTLELSGEEKSSIEDLEKRLRYYQLYRDAGKVLSDNFGLTVLSGPEDTPPRDSMFLPDKYCNLETLSLAMREVLQSLPKLNRKPTAQVRQVISLEEMIKRLEQRVNAQLRTRFSEIRAGTTDQHVVIVGFLAILELCKQGCLLVKQSERYADIELVSAKAETPRYY